MRALPPSYPVRKTVSDGMAVEVPAAEGASIPAGVIVMWHGLLSAIPSGWALCDGTAGTPDLRDRFIVGAANGADPGATGGAASLSHSGTAVAAHAITQPAAHVVTQPSAHTTVAAHTHGLLRYPTTTGGSSGFTADTSMSGTLTAVTQPTASAGDASVTHAGTAVDAHSGASVDAHVVTQPSDHADSRPPFYALAFIMKV